MSVADSVTAILGEGVVLGVEQPGQGTHEIPSCLGAQGPRWRMRSTRTHLWFDHYPLPYRLRVGPCLTLEVLWGQWAAIVDAKVR